MKKQEKIQAFYQMIQLLKKRNDGESEPALNASSAEATAQWAGRAILDTWGPLIPGTNPSKRLSTERPIERVRITL